MGGEIESIGAIRGDLLLNMQQWNQNIAKAHRDEGGLRKSLGDLKRAAAEIAAPLGLAGAAVTGFYAKAIKSAMDYSETQNMIEVSMGTMTEAANGWAKGIEKATGLDATKMMKNASTIKLMTQGMGLSEEAAFSLGKQVSELAMDFSSLKNASVEEAFQKLQSGLSGESEPLKAYGILIDETSTKQWALTHGLIAQGEEMSNAQKVAARWGAIAESTPASKAMGDLMKTIAGGANQLRVFQDQIGMFFRDVGGPLVESASRFMQSVNGMIISARNWMAVHPDFVASISKAALEFGVTATAIDGLGVALPTIIGPLALVAAAMLGPVGALGSMCLGVYALRAVWNNSASDIVDSSVRAGKSFVDMANESTRATNKINSNLNTLSEDQMTSAQKFEYRFAAWGAGNAAYSSALSKSIEEGNKRFGEGAFKKPLLGSGVVTDPNNPNRLEAEKWMRAQKEKAKQAEAEAREETYQHKHPLVDRFMDNFRAASSAILDYASPAAASVKKQLQTDLASLLDATGATGLKKQVEDLLSVAQNGAAGATTPGSEGEAFKYPALDYGDLGKGLGSTLADKFQEPIQEAEKFNNTLGNVKDSLDVISGGKTYKPGTLGSAVATPTGKKEGSLGFGDPSVTKPAENNLVGMFTKATDAAKQFNAETKKGTGNVAELGATAAQAQDWMTPGKAALAATPQTPSWMVPGKAPLAATSEDEFSFRGAGFDRGRANTQALRDWKGSRYLGDNTIMGLPGMPDLGGPESPVRRNFMTTPNGSYVMDDPFSQGERNTAALRASSSRGAMNTALLGGLGGPDDAGYRDRMLALMERMARNTECSPVGGY